MRFISIYFLFCFLPFELIGQNSMQAIRTNEKMIIDGSADEISWNQSGYQGFFTQFSPNPGNPSVQQTTVKICYDDDALYVFAKCFDDPTQLSTVLSQRDDFNANTDNFQIILDTYGDDQNGFVFGVSSVGVQYDSKMFIGQETMELNMVWRSAVKQTTEGWQVEMRIPYSAFRFPKKEVQNWGVNFYRQISRLREESTWQPIKPDFDNFIAQCGELTGVHGIQPPLRLAFMPYVSGYADHYNDETPNTPNWTGQVNGGMDIKFGLNEAFTLDMTLVPDFGQVVFDNQVLNLTPFEIQFNENRQFFTEGTELFNKSGLFYSRRIGIQAPSKVLTTLLDSTEYLTNVPSSSQLYNASKVSGRTKKGLGIGVFNAITAEQKAKAVNQVTNEERDVLISPLTNYNVLVLDQNLKNNSYITFTNTYVWRAGSFYDATVTCLDSKFNTKDNNYGFSVWGILSGLHHIQKPVYGHSAGAEFAKQKGNFVFSSSYFEESDTFDPNDLGFNSVNNKRRIIHKMGYRIFKPFWRINRFSTNLDVFYYRLYAPDVYTSTNVNWSAFMNSKKFHAAGIRVFSTITKNYDYFEPRKWGSYFVQPRQVSVAPWISSNYQKRLAIDADIYWNFIDDKDWKDYGFTFSPRLRVTDKIFLIYSWEQAFSKNGQGYAVQFGIPMEAPNGILFGNRNRTDVVNTIDLAYTLTDRMGVTFRLRHYRSAIRYNYFYYLQDDGSLQRNELTGLDADGNSAYNTNFNAFTIDFVYRWVFLPGSEINVVWKNSIFTNDKRISENYFQNLQGTFENNALNSLSVKVIYWIDYQDLKRVFKRGEK
jgi:hypothetical protein